MAIIIWPIFAFIIGSIPFGLIIAKSACNIDPREAGSCNTGATNVARLCGTKYGIITLALDLTKGYFPVILASAWIEADMALSVVAAAAIFGHAFSCFMNFKGGKAVATTVGAFLALAPGATIIAAILCLAVVALSGHVSMGSLTLALAIPALMILSGNFAFVPVALVVMVLLFWRHRANIQRLARGEENPWMKPKA